MKIALCTIVALAAGVGNLYAQTATEPRRLVFGSVGHARTADDEGFLGSGAAVGVGAGVRVTERLTLQVVFDRIPYYRDADYLVFDGRVLFVGGEAAFTWRPSRVHPFVTIGAGLMNDRKTWTHRVPTGPGGSYRVDSITDYAYTLSAVRTSGGIDIFVTDPVSVRAGLTVHGLLDTGDDLATHVVLQPMAGLVWRW